MSGICGFINLDAADADAGDLGRILSVLERRGPDGTSQAIHGPVALGHASLVTTPEATTEHLPFRHSASDCVITADARLDYRSDLMTKLGFNASERMGDGELIVRAYLKWGTQCLDHLEGDFAFAIWDPREERLFCARDQTGMRQLIYHHRPGKLFAFATEPRALLNHRHIEKRLHEARFADFLEHLEAIDLTSTFFTGLFRLPPAHALIVQGESMRIWRYWTLDGADQPKLKLDSDQEYADAFLDVFSKAISQRLRSPADCLGSMLSGGLDSTSTSAIAADVLRETGKAPLRTYSAISDEPGCPETAAILAAAQIAHIDPTYVSPDDLEAHREELERLTREIEDPFDGQMTLLRSVYLAGRKAGTKVMLDGAAGDLVLGSDNMILWHLQRGSFIKAWQQAKGVERFWGPAPPAWENFARCVGRTRMLSPIRTIWRAMTNKSQASPEAPDTLSPEFAKRVDMPSRRRANQMHIAGFELSKEHDRSISMLHPYVVVARERYDRIAGSLAIEPRDPFLDQRVLRFCMTLPADQFEDNGWPKVILRRAVSGLVPDAVRWRLGKEHLGGGYSEKLWNRERRGLNPNETANMQQYLSRAVLEAAIRGEDGGLSLADSLTLRYGALWLTNLKFD